jgi:hypothetical protein
MRRALFFAALAACACRSGPQSSGATAVTVSDFSLELQPEGRGRLSFALSIGGPPFDSARVEWELRLSGHPFASGVSSASGDPIRVDEPLAFSASGWDARERGFQARIEGTLIISRGSSDTRRAFVHQQRIEVQGAPLFELPRLQ